MLRQRFRYEYDRPAYSVRQRLVVVPDAVVVSRRHRTGTVVARAELAVVPESVEFVLTADGALQALAAPMRGRHPLEVGEEVSALVHAALPYEYGVTSTRTTAAEALAAGRGVCQDHAHVMLAVCRAAGVPARYVSGHLLGEGGTHAWVEVLVPDGEVTRAVALDPCNGCRADARYLTVATGRDYLDVAPISGTYCGDAVGRLTATKQVGLAEAA